MRYIELKRIWTDDDEMLQLEITASNGNQTGNQDFFIYPEQLKEFGEKLANFPTSIDDTVCLEYGANPQFYCYVLIKAQVLENRKTALEIQLDNRLAPPLLAKSNFYITIEPASLNRFGKTLINWANNPSEALRAEFHT